MRDLLYKPKISSKWWINYFAAVMAVLHVLLHAWMDADQITEGTAFVLMTFMAKVCIAYLTSWIFYTILSVKDKVERRSYYKNYVESILDDYAELLWGLFFVDHRLEEHPLDLEEIAALTEPLIIRSVMADDTSGQGNYFQRQTMEMLFSMSKMMVHRYASKMRERRHPSEDRLFSLIDQLELSFIEVPDNHEMNKLHKKSDLTMSVPDMITAFQYYTVRINDLQNYCAGINLISSDYIEDRIEIEFGSSPDEMMQDIKKNFSRTTNEELRAEMEEGKWKWKKGRFNSPAMIPTPPPGTPEPPPESAAPQP